MKKKHLGGWPVRIKKSICRQLIVLVVGLTVLLMSTVMLVNTCLLERLFVQEQVRNLQHAYETLDQMIVTAGKMGIPVSRLFPDSFDSADPEHTGTPATRYLSSLSEISNINIVIVDNQTDRMFAFFGDREAQSQKLSEYIFGDRSHVSGKLLQKNQNYQIEWTVRNGSGSSYLESWGFFSDNTTSFIMSMPTASLREPVRFFNRFLLMIMAIASIAAAVLIYFLAHRVTRPIMELARLSEKMSRQDFSAHYTGDSEDEIGALGNAMNIMSKNLEQTIGELKTANNELKRDVETKTRLAERQQEFVANVSHELKTPIALIQGYAEGLKDGLCTDDAARDEYCGVILEEAKRMNTMVHSLMNLSAIEQGKDAPDYAAFALDEMTEAVVQRSEILIRQKNASVETDIPKGTYVWADAYKIEEVIVNYLNNALHHLGEPGMISLYTENAGGALIRFHVMNSGEPIPEADLDRIWEKFYKVDKAHTRAYGGSGLGLSIVKAIADAHHQRCGVKNTLSGVDFWIELEKVRPVRPV